MRVDGSTVLYGAGSNGSGAIGGGGRGGSCKSLLSVEDVMDGVLIDAKVVGDTAERIEAWVREADTVRGVKNAREWEDLD